MTLTVGEHVVSATPLVSSKRLQVSVRLPQHASSSCTTDVTALQHW